MKSSSEHKTLEFIIDTGASCSAIAEFWLRPLGYSEAKTIKEQRNTASGINYIDIFVMEKIFFAGQAFENIKMNVLKLPKTSQIDGLIGMDILMKFDITLSNTQGTIKIIPVAAS
jgi:predicted aspartyl protease